MAALEARHLAALRFAEVTRALRALSSNYVERRGELASGAALSGAGKRAAFALFYGPLHYLLLQAIAERLPAAASDVAGEIVDLGCGTGAAGAAWALASSRRPSIVGLDRHPWAATEGSWTYRTLGLRGRARVHDLVTTRLPRADAYLAAFILNELTNETRHTILASLLDHARRGASVLIVEPIAKTAVPWWPEVTREVVDAGGRADEWRVQVPLPPVVEKLDRAAGLRHRQLSGRSLWIGRAC
jgi:hypothetical protein